MAGPEKKIQVAHYNGVVEEFKPTAYFCPHCGVQRVWEETGSGDYYAGPLTLCLACGGQFENPYAVDLGKADSWDRHRMETLRKGEGDGRS